MPKDPLSPKYSYDPATNSQTNNEEGHLPRYRVAPGGRPNTVVPGLSEYDLNENNAV